MQIQKEKHALGACSRGRAFLFGFIRRQPYMKQALQCLRMARRTHLKSHSYIQNDIEMALPKFLNLIC